MMNLVWMVVVVIIKQHMAHAKTQYQYANFSMDGDGGHHWTSYGPCHKTQYQYTNFSMDGGHQYQYAEFSMDGYGCHHQTSYGPCQDPIPIHQF